MSLLVFLVSIVICTTLLYNFRWRLIFWFYRKFRRYAEKHLKLDFEYDVYVSYSDDNVTFLTKHLQPKIEREWGLKMCFGDRDFSVGDSTADVRANAIHKSRHVVFLVTPSFVQSEWGRFEIERVKYEKFSFLKPFRKSL